MTATEIKKELYKQKPVAKQTAIYRDGGSKDYETILASGQVVKFHVPFVDQGEDFKKFSKEMEAQLLIRWLI